MNLSSQLQNYLTVRRSLGYNLSSSERILKQFVSFIEARNEHYVTTELFLQWKQVFGKASQSTWVHRLTMVRQFAVWVHNLDSAHQIPPRSLIIGHYQRKQPYIYSEDEIKRLLEGATRLGSKQGLRAITYPAFFGLVSVTGLRISEAIALTDSDVDLENGIVRVYEGKNGRERLLPLTECTTTYLNEYCRKRNRLLGHSPKAFFVGDQGLRLTDCAVRYNFAQVCQQIGLRPAQCFHRHGVGPRIHDLRHTFAVRVMLNWYRQGKDAHVEMLKLVNYLGHQGLRDTYWYLEAIPELLALASQRVEDVGGKEVRSW
jgi:integrase/recombinase XerD